jgi:2-octaprenylphenol hydroxylase
MKSHYDIVIVGGGMVGATFACALGAGPFKVALLERSPPTPPPAPADDYSQRVSAITPASRTLFENLGAWEGMVRQRVARIEAMEVSDAAGGGRIFFDAAEIGEPALAYILENCVIRAALVERLARFTNIHVVYPAAVSSIRLAPEAVEVALEDGRVLAARLVVGADGADSAVRRAAGIEILRHDLKQQAIVATVRTERPHQHVARQVFLDTGPLAFLPLPEPQACSIVWSATRARAASLMALKDEDFAQALAVAFGDALGAIRAVGPRAAFPLALAHARAYTAPRVALIGDAAHSVHPLAGQGANLGFLDAAALAEVLVEANARGRDIGAHHVLRRYERARKGDNLLMLAVTGGLRYLFAAPWLPGIVSLRSLGLRLTDTATPLKRHIMRRAAGLEGERPRLARPDRAA